MHFNLYDIFYEQCSHQHVSAGIPAIFGMMLLFCYKNTNAKFGWSGHKFYQICYIFILVIISPWRWLECRPKHVGENIVNKTYYKYCSAFVDYLYILDNFGGTRYFLLISVHNNRLIIFSA